MVLRRVFAVLVVSAGFVLAGSAAASAAYPPGPPEDDTPPTPGVVCGEQPGDVTTITTGSGRVVTVKPGEFLTITVEGAAEGETIVLDPPNGDPVTLQVKPNATRTLSVGPCSYNDPGDYVVTVGGQETTVKVLTSVAGAPLAKTGGSSLAETLVAGGALVALGGGLVLVSRRRRSTSPTA